MEKVAVVGAGVSGLVTAKELLEEGHEVVIFEQESSIGGVFKTGVSYDRMHLTVSNYFMAYSSLAPPEGQERYYWNRAEYVEYLNRFANHFDLTKRIRFNSTVTRVRREGDEIFHVSSMSPEGSRDEKFTAVAICRGAYRRTGPRKVTFDGEGSFSGETVHTADWRGPEQFRGKRVVCVGLGETSADVTRWISDVAKECWLSMRSYPVLIERYPYGGADTNDAFSTRLSHWIYDIRLFAPLFVALEYYAPEMPPHNRMVWEYTKKAPPGKFLQKNDAFIDNILDGRIKPNFSGIKRLDGKRVIFGDGESVEADMLMLGTGYEEGSIPPEWVDGLDVKDIRSLFKHMFHPDVGSRLAFIGWARPTQGGVPAASEMQARLFALACSGKWALPQKDELAHRIAMDAQRESDRSSGNPYMRTLVHYTSFMDEMADLIGCNPRLADHLGEPELLYRLLCGSNVAACYRLVGPHADPEGAKRLILRLPVALERSMPWRDIFDKILPQALESHVSPSKRDEVSTIVRSLFRRGCEGR